MAIKLVLPVAILVSLACIPALNQLWPHGMTELERQERSLQDALPIGMELEEARDALHSKRIQLGAPQPPMMSLWRFSNS